MLHLFCPVLRAHQWYSSHNFPPQMLQVKIQPPELKGFMEKKLSSELGNHHSVGQLTATVDLTTLHAFLPPAPSSRSSSER